MQNGIRRTETHPAVHRELPFLYRQVRLLRDIRLAQNRNDSALHRLISFLSSPKEECQHHRPVLSGVSHHQAHRTNLHVVYPQLVAVAGFKKRFPNMDLSSLQSGEMALLFPEPVRDFHDLTAQEREEAVLHWRQVEMVVMEKAKIDKAEPRDLPAGGRRRRACHR